MAAERHSDRSARSKCPAGPADIGNAPSADGTTRERFHRFLGVAAGGLRVLEFVILDHQKVGAEAFDLLPGRWTHFGRGDDGR